MDFDELPWMFMEHAGVVAPLAAFFVSILVLQLIFSGLERISVSRFRRRILEQERLRTEHLMQDESARTRQVDALERIAAALEKISA